MSEKEKDQPEEKQQNVLWLAFWLFGLPLLAIMIYAFLTR